MSKQTINARLPTNLQIFGNTLLVFSLIASVVFFYFAGIATIESTYDDWAENGFSPILIGFSLGVIIQGIGLKLTFSFFAEVLIRMNQNVEKHKVLERADEVPKSIETALGIAD